MPTDGTGRRLVDPRLRRAWLAWYRAQGLTSLHRLEELASRKAQRGRWPKGTL